MECTTETDFCLSCFCAGKEPGSHSKHHKYQVLSNLHFPLFGAKWSAEEEMLLLEGEMRLSVLWRRFGWLIVCV